MNELLGTITVTNKKFSTGPVKLAQLAIPQVNIKFTMRDLAIKTPLQWFCKDGIVTVVEEGFTDVLGISSSKIQYEMNDIIGVYRGRGANVNFFYLKTLYKSNDDRYKKCELFDSFLIQYGFLPHMQVHDPLNLEHADEYKTLYHFKKHNQFHLTWKSNGSVLAPYRWYVTEEVEGLTGDEIRNYIADITIRANRPRFVILSNTVTSIRLGVERSTVTTTGNYMVSPWLTFVVGNDGRVLVKIQHRKGVKVEDITEQVAKAMASDTELCIVDIKLPING